METPERFRGLNIHLEGFVDHDIIASGTIAAKPAVIRFPADDPTSIETLGDFQAVTALNGPAGVMSVVTEYRGLQQRPCSSIVSIDTLQARWSSCNWLPQAFSPDGSLVFATPTHLPANGDETLVPSPSSYPLIGFSQPAYK